MFNFYIIKKPFFKSVQNSITPRKVIRSTKSYKFMDKKTLSLIYSPSEEAIKLENHNLKKEIIIYFNNEMVLNLIIQLLRTCIYIFLNNID